MSVTDKQKGRELSLRQRAEAIARHMLSAEANSDLFLPPEESQKTLHELRVHQIELEMQNEVLRDAQEALEESRDRYVDLYDFAPVGYLTLTDKGMIEEINLTAATLLGVERKKLLQLRFASLIVADDRTRWMSQFLNVLEKGDKGDVEVAIKRHDGTVFQAMLDCKRANLGDDEMAIRIALTDISERKQAEVALQESEERWQFALEGAGDGVWDWNIQTGVTFYSRRYKEMLGFAENEIGDTPDEWIKRTHPDDLPSVMANLQSYMEGKPVSTTVECRMLCKDGSWKWTLGRGMLISRDTDSKPLRMIGTNTDITERKQAEADLRESESRWKFAIEGSGDGLWDWNVPTSKVFFSTRWKEMLGFAQDEIGSGLDEWSKRVHPDDLVQVMADLQAHLDGTTPLYSNEHRVSCKDGSWKWILDRGLAIERDAASKPLRVIGTHEDIAERKKAEGELYLYRQHLEKLVEERTFALSIAKEGAEAANRAKTIFLNNMSHELRTPLNGIMGMNGLAMRRATDAKQKDQLAKVEQCTQRLVGVINDILDIAKIESERFTLEHGDFELNEVLENLTSLTEASAKAKGLTLDIDIAPDIAQMQLRGDSRRFGQILLNLTINAIKFAAEGSVSVRATIAEDTPSEVLLRFEVRDTGIGISVEDQKRVFNSFEQADGSTTRKYGGSGLGLAISKRLAQAMGGDITVDSQVGAGSIFRATVRLKKARRWFKHPTTHVGAEPLLQQRWQGNRILVADDEPISAEITEILLEDRDLLVDVAEDGEKAVALARKNSYAAIFMEMQIPKLNGIEATQQIRQLPGYRDTPIIAMTTDALADDKAQCLKAGMNDLLIKPFSSDELDAILLRSLTQRDV